MLHASGLDAEVADLGDAPVLEFDDLEERLHLVVDGTLDEGLDSVCPADRSKHRNLAQGPLGKSKGVVKERHVGEMVGVEVADPDRMQVLEPDVLLQRGQRSAADVHQYVGTASLQQVAGARIKGLREWRVTQGSPPNGTLWFPALDDAALLWIADMRNVSSVLLAPDILLSACRRVSSFG